MHSTGERRKGRRTRARLTAVVRLRRRQRPVILRILNLGIDGAFCRSRVPFRVGATFPMELIVEGATRLARPRALQIYCRVAWAAARLGPSRPMQEVGLEFLEVSPQDARSLQALLADAAAA